MTDDGSPFDEDGEWVTNVPDDDQDEEAADQLERATNLARTSDSSIYNSPEPEMVMTLTDWWGLGIEGQLMRNLRNGDDLAEAVGNLRLHPYYPSKNVLGQWKGYTDSLDMMRGHLYNQLHALFGRLAELAEYIDSDTVHETVDRCPTKIQ
jgi:hypothetical protein